MTMDCRECIDLLSPLLDRELGPGEIAAVRAHLETCVRCCRECALLCCLDAEVRRLRPPEAPTGLWSRVEATIDGLRESGVGADAQGLRTGTDGQVIDFVRARARLTRRGRV